MTALAFGKVQVEAEGQGPAVLLVHGLGGSSTSFQPLLGALSGYRCLRPDLPGSARSPLPLEPLTIAGLAETMGRLADALGASPAHLVGHSMGTLVCQHLAARRPELVRSLTLFGPILEPPDAARERLKERARLARREGMVPVADAVAASSLSPAMQAENPIVAALVRESHLRQDAEAFAQSCEALAAAVAADLRLVRCPTLLVTGADDAVAPPSIAHLIGDRIKGARVRVLERCGHWAPLERPRECARALAEFVRSVAD